MFIEFIILPKVIANMSYKEALICNCESGLLFVHEMQPSHQPYPAPLPPTLYGHHLIDNSILGLKIHYSCGVTNIYTKQAD